STHRVERAMVNSGFQRPFDRVVINLAPAELPKQAASFDLPITLGVLAGSGQLASERFDEYAVVGELSLEGRTRPAKGALSMAMSAARQKGLRGIVVPDTNAAEAAVVEQLEVIPVSSLAEAAAFFAGHLADVRGQESAKRALVIAAAGAHNLLMIGPPGSGKRVYIPRHRTLDPAAPLQRDIPLQRDMLFRRGNAPFSAIDPALFLLVACALVCGFPDSPHRRTLARVADCRRGQAIPPGGCSWFSIQSSCRPRRATDLLACVLSPGRAPNQRDGRLAR
ncbi:MAG: ATP-binding protein, partial [Pirellulaceae bacterium]|nr:ATP-binding protein [Pirellulaceae bacterium]